MHHNFIELRTKMIAEKLIYHSYTCLMLSQSARSLALANAVDSPTILTGFSVCDEIKFVRDTMTSKTGPLSSPRN